MERDSAAVGSALCRAFRVLRGLGVAPLSFTRRHTVTIVRVCSAHVYYGYIFSTILNALIILAFTMTVISIKSCSLYQDATIVGLVILMINLVTSMMIATAAAYGGHKRMKYLVLLLSQLNKITIPIPSDSVIITEKKRTFTASLGMLILVSFIINLALHLRNRFCNYSMEYEAIITFLFNVFHMQNAIVGMLALQIILVICKMQAATKSFNCELKRWLDSLKKGDHVNEVMLFNLRTSFLRVTRHYVVLCESIQRMNSCEGRLMLLVVIFFAMQLMDNSYRLIVVVRLISPTEWLDILAHYLKIAMRLYVTVVHVIMIGSLVNACDNVQEEIQRLRVLVSDLIYRSRQEGETISRAASEICEQVSMHQPTFKPLCIFALTRSLFVTMITGVFTYVITVIKLNAKEENIKSV